MAMTNCNIEIKSGLDSVVIRDFDTDLDLSPNATYPVIQGEWLKIGSDGKVARPTGIANAVAKTAAIGGLVMVWKQKGRSDTQAIGKVACIIGGTFEMDIAQTAIFTATTALDNTEDTGKIAPAAGTMVTIGLTTTAGRALLCRRTANTDVATEYGEPYGSCIKNDGSAPAKMKISI